MFALRLFIMPASCGFIYRFAPTETAGIAIIRLPVFELFRPTGFKATPAVSVVYSAYTVCKC